MERHLEGASRGDMKLWDGNVSNGWGWGPSSSGRGAGPCTVTVLQAKPEPEQAFREQVCVGGRLILASAGVGPCLSGRHPSRAWDGDRLEGSRAAQALSRGWLGPGNGFRPSCLFTSTGLSTREETRLCDRRMWRGQNRQEKQLPWWRWGACLAVAIEN